MIFQKHIDIDGLIFQVSTSVLSFCMTGFTISIFQKYVALIALQETFANIGNYTSSFMTCLSPIVLQKISAMTV